MGEPRAVLSGTSFGPSVEGTRGQNHLYRFEAWATLFTSLCLFFSEETVKAVGPFYQVSIQQEVKDPIQEKTCCRLIELVVSFSKILLA